MTLEFKCVGLCSNTVDGYDIATSIVTMYGIWFTQPKNTCVWSQEFQIAWGFSIRKFEYQVGGNRQVEFNIKHQGFLLILKQMM